MKYLLSLMLVLLTLVTSAQEAVTFEKYEYDRTEADGCKAWFCGRFGAIKVEAKVIDVPDVTAEELYNKAKKWINETYKGGTDIILGDNENEYIRKEYTNSWCRKVEGCARSSMKCSILVNPNLLLTCIYKQT